MFDMRYSWAESILREVDAPEKEDLVRRLESEWGVNHYWFPLREKIESHANIIEAFQAIYFEEESTHETLQQILAAHGIATIFEKREDGAMCEIELAQFHPNYTGLEGFWFTPQLDWLIYASHEGSITFGGEWLLPAVKVVLPDWKSRIYRRLFMSDS